MNLHHKMAAMTFKHITEINNMSLNKSCKARVVCLGGRGLLWQYGILMYMYIFQK